MSHRRNFAWTIVIPLLLLMVAVSTPRLDSDGLWYDEVWSVYNAGGFPYEPLSPAGIWTRLATEDPDQGLAYPLILAAWGAAAGWTEFATRYLSLLVGCLAAAGVFRLGRDTVSPRTGLFAAAILSVSAFFIYYTHELRVFTIVALSSALLLWCYWKIVYRPRSARAHYHAPLRLTDVGFVVAGMGLTYTHYFAATMLITVGLYHVIFAPGSPIQRIWQQFRARRASPLQRQNFASENRRWWRPVILAVVIGMLFVPWLPVFISSITRTSTRDDVHAKSLAPLALLETLFGYFGNGIGMFALVLVTAGLVYAIYVDVMARRRGDTVHRPPQKQGIRFVAGIAALAVPVIVITNMALQIIEPGRARYLIILWIPLALLAGRGIEGIANLITQTPPLTPPRRQGGEIPPPLTGEAGGGFSPLDAPNLIAAVLIIAWLMNGVLANMNPAFVTVFGGNPVPRWQAMTRIMTAEGLPEDLLAFYAGERHYELKFSFDHAVKALHFPALITRALAENEFKDDALNRIRSARRIWYGIDTREPELDEFTVMQPILASEFILCDAAFESDSLRFSLYAHSQAFCPGGAPQMRFGTGIELTGIEPLPEMIGRLILPLGWTLAPDVPPDTYSVAVQILDEQGNLVAQGSDTGLPAGRFVTMQFDIDVAALPPGNNGIYVIVYNWRTMERLPGTHLITGENGDMLRLLDFPIAEN